MRKDILNKKACVIRKSFTSTLVVTRLVLQYFEVKKPKLI